MSVWRRAGAGLGFCSLALSLMLGSSATGHDGLHEQIAVLTKRIKQDPTNADLYVQRGNLHRAHHDWDTALTDYDRAARLDPELTAVELVRGLAFLEAGRPESAKLALDRFLSRPAERVRLPV